MDRDPFACEREEQILEAFPTDTIPGETGRRRWVLRDE
jgi:hypothetical protein